MRLAVHLTRDCRAADPAGIDDIRQVGLTRKYTVGLFQKHRRVLGIDNAIGAGRGQFGGKTRSRCQLFKHMQQRGLAGIDVRAGDREDRRVDRDPCTQANIAHSAVAMAASSLITIKRCACLINSDRIAAVSTVSGQGSIASRDGVDVAASSSIDSAGSSSRLSGDNWDARFLFGFRQRGDGSKLALLRFAFRLRPWRRLCRLWLLAPRFGLGLARFLLFGL